MTLCQQWLRKSNQDLIAAETLLKLSPDVSEELLDIICFHLQQAVEKSLKGLLILHGQAIVCTHDLCLLQAMAAPIMANIADHNTLLIALNRYVDDDGFPDSAATTLKHADVVTMPEAVTELVTQIRARCAEEIH
ncbi:MAG: HEPN domain-containing protein [Magnetococcales bacterium]|nr:HEPN domain-containing protein [Magnetococcales bacterium]